VAGRQRQGRAQGDRHRRAVLLQEPQEGDRAVQAAALVAADAVKQQIAAAYDRKFEFLFTQLAVGGTRAHVEKYVQAPEQHRTMPINGQPAVEAAPDDADLSD
jgi:hypothetical protein